MTEPIRTEVPILTPAELADLAVLAEAGTARPWLAFELWLDGRAPTREEMSAYVASCIAQGSAGFHAVSAPLGDAEVCHTGNGPTSERNAALIVAAVNALPRLLAHVAAQAERIGEAEKERDEVAELLGEMYDAWENGDSIHEGGEADGVFLGHALDLSEEQDNRILAALKRHGKTHAGPTHAELLARADAAEAEMEHTLAACYIASGAAPPTGEVTRQALASGAVEAVRAQRGALVAAEAREAGLRAVAERVIADFPFVDMMPTGPDEDAPTEPRCCLCTEDPHAEDCLYALASAALATPAPPTNVVLVPGGLVRLAQAQADVAMRHADVEALRDPVKAALPKWPWDDPEHDPLHAHPFEQVFRTVYAALTSRTLAAEALLRRSGFEGAVCVCHLRMGGCFPCEVRAALTTPEPGSLAMVPEIEARKEDDSSHAQETESRLAQAEALLRKAQAALDSSEIIPDEDHALVLAIGEHFASLAKTELLEGTSPSLKEPPSSFKEGGAQGIARVKVDETGNLWLHLDGGEGCCKASLNVSALIAPDRSFASPGPTVQKGVRQAIEALSGAQASTPEGGTASLPAGPRSTSDTAVEPPPAALSWVCEWSRSTGGGWSYSDTLEEVVAALDADILKARDALSPASRADEVLGAGVRALVDAGPSGFGVTLTRDAAGFQIALADVVLETETGIDFLTLDAAVAAALLAAAAARGTK